MKTTIALPKEIIYTVCNTHLAMLQRKRNKESNMLIGEILDTDIKQLQSAMNTMTESK